MEIKLENTEKTEELAGRIAEDLYPGAVIALYGDLGSGKTTFTGFLVKALNIDARVQSPTFVLIREYKSDKKNVIGKVNHIDLYRIKDVKEIEDLGLEEIFAEPDAIAVIEWPELIEEKLPQNVIKIKFTYDKDGRKAEI
jgi:tRNA threonylcarbamoyladenosine biosynthesis protein TsaE